MVGIEIAGRILPRGQIAQTDIESPQEFDQIPSKQVLAEARWAAAFRRTLCQQVAPD